MTYVFDLELISYESRSAVRREPSGTRSLSFVLGYELDRDIAVLMSVMLVAGDSFVADVYAEARDLQFGIRTLDINAEVFSPPDFDSLNAKQYVPKEEAAKVFENVLQAIHILLQDDPPAIVTMETFLSFLPPNALEKYDRISDILHRWRYRTEQRFRDEGTGIDYWLFVRTAGHS